MINSNKSKNSKKKKKKKKKERKTRDQSIKKSNIDAHSQRNFEFKLKLFDYLKNVDAESTQFGIAHERVLVVHVCGRVRVDYQLEPFGQQRLLARHAHEYLELAVFAIVGQIRVDCAYGANVFVRVDRLDVVVVDVFVRVQKGFVFGRDSF
jgi:hypothetical protein